MGSTGPKPTRQAARTGDGVASERTPPGSVIEVSPPDDLSDVALEIWHETVPHLVKRQLLSPEDYTVLVEAIEATARVRVYRREWNEKADQGTVTQYDRNGEPHEVPFIGSKVEKRIRSGLNQTMGNARQLWSEFGMTPSARMRLGAVQELSAANSFMEALKDAS